MIPIIALPFLTKLLTPEDYGTLSMFIIINMLVGNLIRIELNSALKREYAEKKSNFSEYIGTAFIFSSILFIAFIFILYLIALFIKSLYGIPNSWLLGILFISYFRFHSVCLHHLFYLTNQAFIVGLWGFLATIGTFSITILLLTHTDMQWQSRAWAELIIALLSFPISIYFLYKKFSLKIKFNIPVLKAMLGLSLPLFIASMLNYILMILDRLFITEIVGIRELGLYTVAMQVASIVSLFMSSIQPSWESWLYTQDPKANKVVIKKILIIFLFITIISFFLLIITPPIIIKIIPYVIDKNFEDSIPYIFPAMLTITTLGLHGILTSILIFIKKTNMILKIQITIIIFSIFFLTIFIKNWGAVGAAYGLSASYITGIAITLYSIIKHTNDNEKKIY